MFIKLSALYMFRKNYDKKLIKINVMWFTSDLFITNYLQIKQKHIILVLNAEAKNGKKRTGCNIVYKRIVNLT